MSIECPHCHHKLELVLAYGTSPAAEALKDARELNLAEAVTIYCAEQRVTGAWSPAWAPTAEAHLRRFATSQHPLDRSGVAVWRQELLASAKTPRTVNSHLASLGAFCQWLVNRGDLETNPARGQSVKGKKVAASDERLAFEPKEVAALLSFCSQFAPTPGHAALVAAMAYTGARNEELGQLRVGDIKVVDNITVFDLATMDDGQRRKTSASRRLVPIHSKLQSALATLPTLVPNNSTGGILRNLMGFSERNGRWAYTASRWVNDVAIPKLQKNGVIRDDKRLTLYSLRHSVATQLKHKGIQEDLIAELVGHTNSSMTTGRYGKRYPVEKLLAVVESIHW